MSWTWHDRSLWRQARCLEDVAELTARWLEGSVRVSPSYGGRPHAETQELMPLLVDLNRAGVLTSQSQPGYVGEGADGARWEQRAGLEGFCHEDLAESLVRTASAMGMYVTAYDRSGRLWDDHMLDELIVTTRDGEPHTAFGRWQGVHDLEVDYGRLHQRVVRDLRDSCQIAVVDPQWGRTGVLQEALETAVRATGA